MASSVFCNFDEYDDEAEGSNDNDNTKYANTKNNYDIISDDKVKTNEYKFTPKYKLSIKNNPMSGICFPEWISILHKRWHQIEWTVYWPRLLFITGMSIMNSILGFIEHFAYGKRINSIQIHPRPVFILGHPRTGTTLLHSLLSLDTNQFSYCSTFCAGFPSCFLWFESIGKILFSGVIDETRPMDNVKLDFDLPQEDELATNVISGGISPYMPLFFMKQEIEFRPFYAFDNDNYNDNDHHENDDEKLEPNIMANARKIWIDSFLYLLRKLTVRDVIQRAESVGDATRQHRQQQQQQQQQRRLLLKSPVHTARIALLNQLFPECQFIYIHRNPYDIFRSATHMADTTYWYTYLNTPSNEQITEFILRQYEILYDRYEAGRKQILLLDSSSSGDDIISSNNDGCNPQKKQLQQPQRIVEVSFDDLSQQPIQTARRIYRQLGWNWTTTYQRCLESELAGHDQRSYQRNLYKPLEKHWKDIINERWGKSFERFSYAKE